MSTSIHNSESISPPVSPSIAPSLEPKTRKGQATKNKMISVAAQLMHKNGVHATTVNDILSHSNTGKSQFSHYFGSKESLIVEVIRHHVEDVVPDIEQLLTTMTSLHDLDKLILACVEKQKESLATHHAGCPIGQIALETTGDNETVLAELKTAFSRIRISLADFFSRMQNDGKMQHSVDTEALACFFVSCIQGGVVIAKTAQNVQPLENVLNHGRHYICSFSC